MYNEFADSHPDVTKEILGNSTTVAEHETQIFGKCKVTCLKTWYLENAYSKWIQMEETRESQKEFLVTQ